LLYDCLSQLVQAEILFPQRVKVGVGRVGEFRKSIVLRQFGASPKHRSRNMWRQLAPNQVFILIAPGFEEKQTVHFLSSMREAGIPVSLIGLSADDISGLHGIMLHPDYALGEIPAHEAGALVVMPGGRQCISGLMADPRVHQLLQNTVTQQGYIAATKSAENILPHTHFKNILTCENFKPQGEMEFNEFTDHLIKLVS
jgi:hypothetical protein